jgi:MFS family permease
MLSDAIPICGTRRKGWLGLCGVVGAAGYVAVGILPPAPFSCTVALFATNLASAFCDVVVDAMVAEGARQESENKAGDLQSLAWGCYAIGSFAGALLGGLLYNIFGAQNMMIAFGLVFSSMICLACNLEEPRRPPASLASLAKQARLALQTCRSPLVAKVCRRTMLSFSTRLWCARFLG